MNDGTIRRCSCSEPMQTGVALAGAEVRLRPQSCRTYLRQHVAAAWPNVVTALLEKAKEGSVSHISLAAKLAGFDFRPQPRRERKRQPEKSFAKQLLEEMEELETRNIAEFGPL